MLKNRIRSHSSGVKITVACRRKYSRQLALCIFAGFFFPNMKDHTEQPCEQARTADNYNFHQADLLLLDNAVYAAAAGSVQ